MVDRLTGPSGQEDQTTESTPKEESKLQKHLRKLGIFGEAKKDATESDDDEETDKPKKKFRKFFKGLFKSVVEPPESSSATTEQKPTLESLFFGWQEPELQDTDLSEASEVIETPVADQERVGLERVQENVSEGSEISQQTDTPSSEIIDNSPVNPEAVPRQYEAPIIPESNTVFERSTPKPQEKDVVIQRGSNLLPVALVGAEYLARKRADRKLDAKLTEKTEKLEQKDKEAAYAHAQLDTLMKQNREQLEKLKRERLQPVQAEQAVASERPSKPEVTALAYDRRKVSNEVPKPEESRISSSEQFVKQDVSERREQYKIMEQVANAAENNEPVEIAFERSHEVKDDVSTTSAAASIGAIMAAQAEEQKHIARVQAVQQQMGDAAQGLPVLNDSQAADMYQQAMKRGFWAAVAIIILGLLAYLVK